MAILKAVRGIKRGTFASYGEVARRAGLPGRARLVGTVLRESGNDSALAVASRHGCWRTHRVSGRLAARARADKATRARRREGTR